MACFDGWAVIYSVIADMLADGVMSRLVAAPSETDAKPAPWPGLDAWLNETPAWLLGYDNARLAGFNPDTWGNDPADWGVPPLAVPDPEPPVS